MTSHCDADRGRDRSVRITTPGREVCNAIAPASLDVFVRHRFPAHRPEDDAHMLEGLRKAGWDG